MMARACITTSWDDGHPLDLRLADLLSRYGLKGTFYIPRHADRPTLSEGEIRQIASGFEVGAHTLDHVALTSLDSAGAWRQIVGSRTWLEQITARACRMFCPPLGRFTSEHLRMLKQAGFLALRSVEFLSLDFPRDRGGIMEMPTTLQAHPHGMLAYLKNAAKRGAAANFRLYLRYGCFARRLLELTLRVGGVFHLWGHSWEIDEARQWGQLGEAFRMLKDAAPAAESLTNAELSVVSCRSTRPQPCPS